MRAHHLNIRALIDALSLTHRLVLANGVSKRREAEAGMADSEGEHSDDDHDTLEDNEFGLVAHELAPPSTSQFRDTVDTSNKDAKEGSDDGEHEAAEGCLADEGRRFNRELVTAAVGTESIFA